MDTITHGIVGALAGKAFFAGSDEPARSRNGAWTGAKSSPAARAAILACMIGSIFPDIDIFAGTLARNPLAIMEWHRNITHSLLLLPVWAAMLAGLSLPLSQWLHWKTPSYFRLFGIYALGLATHVFLDVITNFGTMVWSPLKYSRPAWDWVYILDLTLTAIALVPQLAAWCYRDPERFRRRATMIWAALSAGACGAYVLADAVGYGFSVGYVPVISGIMGLVIFAPAIRIAGYRWSRANWCRAGVALLCAYLAVAGILHRKALADVGDFAVTHHLAEESRAALPLPPALTHWAGLIGTPEGVWRTTFHEPGHVVERTQFYASEQSGRYVDAARKLHDVQVYLWFARFPIWKVEHQEEQIIVDVSDVRFFREDETGENIQASRSGRLDGGRGNAPGFTFEVVFDARGRVVGSGFKRPER